MKNTLLLTIFSLVMSTGHVSASNAAVTAPVPDAAADIKSAAAEICGSSAASCVLDRAELVICPQKAGECLMQLFCSNTSVPFFPKPLIDLMKAYLKGYMVIENNLPADVKGLVVVKFQGENIKVLPGQQVDLFAGVDLMALETLLTDPSDKFKSVEFTLSYHSPKRGTVVSEKHGITKKMMTQKSKLVIKRDQMSVDIAWQYDK